MVLQLLAESHRGLYRFVKPSATYRWDDLRQVTQHSMSQFSCLYMVDCYKTTLDKTHLSKCMSLWSLPPDWIWASIMNCLVQQTIMQVCDIIQVLDLGIKSFTVFIFTSLKSDHHAMKMPHLAYWRVRDPVEKTCDTLADSQ